MPLKRTASGKLKRFDGGLTTDCCCDCCEDSNYTVVFEFISSPTLCTSTCFDGSDKPLDFTNSSSTYLKKIELRTGVSQTEANSIRFTKFDGSSCTGDDGNYCDNLVWYWSSNKLTVRSQVTGGFIFENDSVSHSCETIIGQEYANQLGSCGSSHGGDYVMATGGTIRAVDRCKCVCSETIKEVDPATYPSSVAVNLSSLDSASSQSEVCAYIDTGANTSNSSIAVAHITDECEYETTGLDFAISHRRDGEEGNPPARVPDTGDGVHKGLALKLVRGNCYWELQFKCDVGDALAEITGNPSSYFDLASKHHNISAPTGVYNVVTGSTMIDNSDALDEIEEECIKIVIS